MVSNKRRKIYFAYVSKSTKWKFLNVFCFDTTEGICCDYYRDLYIFFDIIYSLKMLPYSVSLLFHYCPCRLHRTSNYLWSQTWIISVQCCLTEIPDFPCSSVQCICYYQIVNHCHFEYFSISEKRIWICCLRHWFTCLLTFSMVVFSAALINFDMEKSKTKDNQEYWCQREYKDAHVSSETFTRKSRW